MFEGVIQPTHLIVILVVILLVAGPRRLPEMGRSLGEGIREFRSVMSAEARDDERSEDRR